MNSNNSDGLSSPEKREEVVPGNLKEIYWDGDNNITPSDVRLFLGLFYEKRKINNENHPRTFSEISNIVSNSKIYLNLSTDANISIPTIIAMSHGCILINNQSNPLSRILNGTNGIVYDNSQNLLTYIQQLLSNQHQLQVMSNSAVETVRIQFNQQRFIKQWDLIFSQLTNVT